MPNLELSIASLKFTKQKCTTELLIYLEEERRAADARNEKNKIYDHLVPDAWQRRRTNDTFARDLSFNQGRVFYAASLKTKQPVLYASA